MYHTSQNTFIQTVMSSSLDIVMLPEQEESRALKFQSTEIQLSSQMPITIRQDRFLANGKNKASLIQALTEYMEKAEIRVKHAEADAGTLIVNTAIELSDTANVVVVIGTDVDLLILLTTLSNPDNNVYLCKPGVGNIPDTIYNIQRVHYSLQYFNNSLLLSPARRGRGILVAPASGVTFFCERKNSKTTAYFVF